MRKTFAAHIVPLYINWLLCTSGSRGAHPARAPLTAADIGFFYAQNAKFSQFFFHFKHNFNRNRAKNMLK